jgi:hypothetical protein
VIIDLRRDVPVTEIKRYVDKMQLSTLEQFFTAMTFRFMLLKRAYTKPELEKMLTGFKKAEIRIDDIGMEAWFEK